MVPGVQFQRFSGSSKAHLGGHGGLQFEPYEWCNLKFQVKVASCTLEDMEGGNEDSTRGWRRDTDNVKAPDLRCNDRLDGGLCIMQVLLRDDASSLNNVLHKSLRIYSHQLHRPMERITKGSAGLFIAYPSCMRLKYLNNAP